MKKLLPLFVMALCSVILAQAQSKETITIDIGAVNITDPVVKPHMLGVIAGPAPNYRSPAPDLTSRYRDIGVTTIRNNDYFDDRLDMERMFFSGSYPINQFTPVYPKWDGSPDDPGNYHFTESDAQFQNWVDGGFVPFFRLGGENSHIPRQHDYKGPRSTEEANWIQAGLKVVDRYNTFGGKTNTLQNYLDIWTEYPQHSFWDRDSLAFNNFWCSTFDALKKSYPSLKIGGPGFNTSVSTHLGNSTSGNVKIWIELFLKELKTRNLKPDWIGFHVFSNSIEDFYNASVAFRKLLMAEAPFNSYSSVWGSGNNSFFKDTELICDAWGFDNDQSLSASARDSLFNKQMGAAHHVGAFIAFQQADIERAYIYRGGEMGSDTAAGVMGLFQGNAEGGYKPVAYGFKLCSRMQTHYNKKLVTPVFAQASGGSKIWTLAGEDSKGNKAILIANPTDKEIDLSLTLNGLQLSTATYPVVKQYVVTDSNPGETGTSWSGGSFTLAPYTANLITMAAAGSGILEESVDNEVIVTFPNPANDILNFSGKLENIKVYNAHGQQVLPDIKSATSLSVVNLPDGVYFLHSTNAIRKFLVRHQTHQQP
ncbi:MAG: hypothetical protein A2X22_01435 [Bacteroidetes bacterium GWF2_49_14]|nr:MAG: hypothetical protein A2X22_01435 [Bacteroidetes bacterium GWF2_49_14]